MDGIFNGNVPFQGVMYRVSCNRSTASNCTFQPLILWKSKPLSVTTQSQNVSRSLILPLCSLVPFYFWIHWFWVLDLSFIQTVENCTLVSFLLVLSKFIPWIVFYWNLETWSRFFYGVSLLLLIITDFTIKIP